MIRNNYKALTDQNPKIKTYNWFLTLALTHLLVWTMIPSLLRPALPADTAEGLTWGNLWLFGYAKHPFLAPWLTSAASDLTGGSIGWPQYLVSQLAVVLCFWAVWRLAARILPEAQALVATILLNGIYYYNIATPQFNPNVIMLPTWALLMLAFYLAVTEEKTWQWLLTGFLAGLAMMAKYESALLLLAMLIFTLVNPQARKAYQRLDFYVAIIIFISVCTPNFIWLKHNNWLPITYTDGRLDVDHYSGLQQILNHTVHPLYFFVEQLGALLPSVVMFIPLFFCKRSQTKIDRFNSAFLWIVGLGALWTALIYSVLTGAWLHSLWGFPFFSVFGILLVAWWRPIITKSALKQFVVLATALFLLTTMGYGVWLKAEPYIEHKEITAIFPGKPLATDVTNIWHKHYHSRLPYIAGWHIAIEYISAYSPDKPTPYYEWRYDMSPWVDVNDLKKQGGIFIWKQSKNSTVSTIPAKIAKRFSRAIALPILVEPLITGAKIAPYHFGVAILPPEMSNEVKNG